MKEKFFSQLKKDHANLGLSDDVLQAYAEANAGLVNDDNLATASQSAGAVLKAIQSNFDRLRNERTTAQKELEAVKEQIKKSGEKKETDKETPIVVSGGDDIEAKIKAAIEATTKPLIEQMNALANEKKLTQRQIVIETKAKELGIPKWRVDEGFIIPEDASDETIGAILAKAQQNLVTSGMPLEKGLGSGTREVTKLTPEQLDKML